MYVFVEKRTKLAYVGVGQAKAPRNVLRAQLKYGTAGKKPIPYASESSKSKHSSEFFVSFHDQIFIIALLAIRSTRRRGQPFLFYY